MTRVAAVLLLAWVLAACGKYGPPLRAGQAKPEKATPRLEVPLPLPPDEEPPEAKPAGEPAPEVEQEPPPEGAP